MANIQRNPEKEAFWRGVLKRCDASTLSTRQFCRREHLSESSFYAWRREIERRDREGRSISNGKSARRQRPAASDDPPAFVPIVLSEHANDSRAIVIELQGGRRMRLPETFEPTRLAELVHALETTAQNEAKQP